MKHWFKDSSFRSVLKNSSLLTASKAVAGVAGLASLAFAGRGLGVAGLGVLILLNSYAKAASGFTKFQSWQLIIRYGGQILSDGRADEFKASTGFAFALDLLSGVVGMILAIALLPFVGHWFGIEGDNVSLAMLYCTLLPTMGAATPIGVLRSLDRFDLISWQGTTYPIARAILAGIAWAAGLPFPVFVAIWYVTDLGGDLYLWFLAWRELRRRELLPGIRPTLRPKLLPGAWKFAIHVNLTSSLSTAWGPMAQLVVGGLLNPSAAALFRIASSLADSAQKPADFLGKAFYPEIVRLDVTSKHPWRLMIRSAVLAGLAASVLLLILALGGQPLVTMLFGKSFAGAYPILLVLMIVPLIGAMSFPMPSMLYALDRPDAPLKARIVGTGIYFILVAPMCWRFGVLGAATAFVAAYAAMTLMLVLQLRSEYRRVRSRRA